MNTSNVSNHFTHVGRDRTRKMVRGYVVGGTAEQIEAIVDRCLTTHEGIWHAASVVTGKACFCCACRPDIKTRI